MVHLGGSEAMADVDAASSSLTSPAAQPSTSAGDAGREGTRADEDQSVSHEEAPSAPSAESLSDECANLPDLTVTGLVTCADGKCTWA